MKSNLKSTFMTALISLSLLTSSSCKKDSIETQNDLALPSSAKFQDLRANFLHEITQTKTFKAEEGLQFTSIKGVSLVIHPNCLVDENNIPVSGDVTLSFIEIFDRAHMVLANKPVMGRNTGGEILPLVTGGQYNISIKKGDIALQSGCGYSVSVPAAPTGGLDSEMLLWTGSINSDGNLVWDETGVDGKEAGIGINTESATYSIWNNEFGWTNVDRFYHDPRPKTKIKVTVPNGYNKDNAAVYLAYEGEPNVLAQLDTYDTVDHYFSEHYGFIPVGMTLHVIFVSESNGGLVYAIKKATVVANGTIAMVNNDLKMTTKDQLMHIINTLN